MNKINNATLIKVAQINKAAKHVLRSRMMKRAGVMLNIRDATPRDEEIAKLKKIRDSYGLWSLLKGMGIGGLAGVGLGQGSALLSDAVNDTLIDYDRVKGSLTHKNPLTPWLAGGLGSIAGGVKGAIDHAQRRQRAIERLKELGVEDTIGK